MYASTMPIPARHEHEILSHNVFTALMWGLTYPASKQASAGASLLSIGQALLDLETSFFCPDARMAKMLRLTSAKEKDIGEADYLFFSELNLQMLQCVNQAKNGTMLAPDDSATLVLMCTFDSGTEIRVTGAGVETETHLQTTLPVDFWELRQNACAYPLGWDIFLCDGSAIVGIPRSSTIDILGYN